jgi:hypothetical protein
MLQDQISRLNQENGSLKQKLDTTKEDLNVSRNEHRRASTSSIKVVIQISIKMHYLI